MGVPMARTTPENLRKCSLYFWNDLRKVVEYF